MARIVSDDEARELLEPFGGEDAVRVGLSRLRANRKYLDENRERLKRQYPDQWIAILRRQVVAHGDTPEGVMRTVREAFEDSDGVVLKLLSSEERTWIL